MNLRHHFRQLVFRTLLASLSLMLFAQQVLAQDEDTGPKEKSYAMPYLIVALMVILGLTLALRPSMRHKEFRPPAE